MSRAEAQEAALALLGLARRAGKLAMGASAVEQMVRRGRRPVIVLASDAGPSQLRKLRQLRPVRGFLDGALDREQLARRLGRRDLAAVAVADPGFVSGLQKTGLVVPADDGD